MTETTLTPAGDTTTGADANTAADAAALKPGEEGYVEPKPGDSGKPADKAELDADGKPISKPDDKAATGAPETYAEFTLPEGVTIAEANLATVHGLFKDANLSQELAQKFIDYESERALETVKEFEKAQLDAFKKQQEDWIKELKEDKEFGGDKLDSNTGLAVKVVNKFGSPELKAVLDQTGMGNNPALIKMFHKIGKAISEDSLLDDAANTGASEKSKAEILYPSQASG